MQQSAPEGTYGPHTTRAANTLDPRIDSDMDNRGAPPPPTTHQPPVTAGLNSTATTTAATTENTGERIARGIKGKVAQGHVRPPPPIVGSVCVLMGCVCVQGIGESLRGNIMSGVDSLVGDKEKQPRHEAIAAGGDREVLNKEFERKGGVHKGL